MITTTARPTATALLLGLALCLGCDGESPARGPDGRPGDAGTDPLDASTKDARDARPDDSAESDAPGSDDATAAAVNCSALSVNGDPTSNEGATWTYQSTDPDGQAFDLQGVLFSPSGPGPFPGAVLSHGKGGSPHGFPTTLAREMATWGVVGVAPAYTHALVPAGLPAGPDGASSANLQRAHKARDLLSCLGYVRIDRIAAHGHSMGGFVTTALVGAHPTDYHVASHTAAGFKENAAPPYPSAAQVSAIDVPYQIHHGGDDTIVGLEDDQALAALLGKAGVTVELHVYQGYTHNEVATDDTMLERVRSWYTSAGLFE